MRTFIKPERVSRETVEAFYQAYTARDLVKLGTLLDDDAIWTINGPVELLQFCGERRGKQAVLDMVGRLVPEVFEITGFAADTMLIDDDRAASLNRLTGRRAADGRIISYRVATFVRFCNGKVVEYCSVIDSFDAAEQVLGHPFTLADGIAVSDGALVTL
jgi:ketosteroid isomerase-like protein